MRVPVIKLEPLQHKFIREFVRLGDIRRAAEEVGIPHSTAHMWINSPEFAAAMHLDILCHIHQAAPKALKTLLDFIDRADTPPKIKLAAAESVLDRAGFTRNPKTNVERDTAAIENMTRKQLVEFISSLESKEEAPIHAFEPVPLNTKPLNFLD